MTPEKQAAKNSARAIKAAATRKSKKAATAPKGPAVEGSRVTKPAAKVSVKPSVKALAKRMQLESEPFVVTSGEEESEVEQQERGNAEGIADSEMELGDT